MTRNRFTIGLVSHFITLDACSCHNMCFGAHTGYEQVGMNITVLILQLYPSIESLVTRHDGLLMSLRCDYPLAAQEHM